MIEGAVPEDSRTEATLTEGLTDEEAQARLARDGPNEVRERRVHPLVRLARKFWGLSAWMLELIVALSLLLGKRVDAWVAGALLVVNAVLSALQEQRASAAVAALRRELRVIARVRRGGVWQSLPSRNLVVGDVLRIRAGDIAPADCRILDGEVAVDQSALTGESQAVHRRPREAVYAGALVRRGEATAVVTATGIRTYFGRTIELVQTARPRLHIDDVMARLVKWLFLIVGTLVAVTLLLSAVRGIAVVDILPLTLVLLMSAVPVALPVMFTVSAAVGARELGRRGVLMTQMAAVEDAASMDVLCADKTGTLTVNRLSVTDVLGQPERTEADVVRVAALASNAANQDPIDVACLAAATKREVIDSSARPVAFVPFSPDTRRTEAVVEVDGRRIRAVKGALRTVAELAGMDPAAVSGLEQAVNARTGDGARAIAVATGPADGPLSLVGVTFLRDAPRPDSRALIGRLRSLGVRVLMLTGDALPAARSIGREVGLGAIARFERLRVADDTTVTAEPDPIDHVDGFSDILPEDKFRIVKALQARGHIVGMTGDGVNDAPALRQAEVGIAVSGATDVAKSAASLVLTTDGLIGVIDVVQVGRSIYQRVLTWIVNKISRTILKAGFVVIAFIVTGQFVISALGMILLVFMTDFAKVSLSTDRVRPSAAPETWKIGPLVAVAIVLGVLMTGEALALLAAVWHPWALASSAGDLRMFSFLLLLFLAVFSVLSIRERGAFWRSRPSGMLMAALTADVAAGVVVGLVGIGDLTPIGLPRLALMIAYALGCGLGPNDWIKTILIARWWRAMAEPGAASAGKGERP